MIRQLSILGLGIGGKREEAEIKNTTSSNQSSCAADEANSSANKTTSSRNNPCTAAADRPTTVIFHEGKSNVDTKEGEAMSSMDDSKSGEEDTISTTNTSKHSTIPGIGIIQKFFTVGRKGQSGIELDEADEKREEFNKILKQKREVIQGLEQSKATKNQMLEALRAELDELKRRERESLYLWKLEIETMRREREAMSERLRVFQRDMEDSDSMAQYANLIKETAPKGGADSKYVMKLQEQIDKASKKINDIQEEINSIEISNDEEITCLKEDICQVVGEKCLNEMALKGQLFELKQRKILTEAELNEKLKSNDLVLKALEEAGGNSANCSTNNVTEGTGKASELDREINELMQELLILASDQGYTEDMVRETIEEKKKLLQKGEKSNEHALLINNSVQDTSSELDRNGTGESSQTSDREHAVFGGIRRSSAPNRLTVSNKKGSKLYLDFSQRRSPHE